MYRSCRIKYQLYDTVVWSLRTLSTAEQSPRVKICQGELLGRTDKTITGNKFLSFQGIPYAKPPLGKLRFKPPQAPEGWTGLRDATKEGNVSHQIDLRTGKFAGNEDCLFLNVYTPKLTPKKLYPVMVFIHGGAYLGGSGNSDMYGPHFFLDKDVVFVTINYRLGPLGFLQLDIPEVPGNAGSRDQIAALQWIQKNIGNFGGDPNNVTAIGSSAGGFSLHMIMLSPMGQGLFHKVILQGGTALTELAYTKDGSTKAFHLAKVLGKETTTPEDTLKYLQSASVKDIMKNQLQVKREVEKRFHQPIPFTPTVEKKFSGVPTFLPAHPASIIKSGEYNKVPLMVGYNEKDGLAVLPGILKKINGFNEDIQQIIPQYLNVEIDTDVSRNVAKEIRKFFFKGKPACRESLPDLVDWLTDSSVMIGANMTVGMHLQTMDLPIYMYRFSFCGLLNLYKTIIGMQEQEGACHGDELFYLMSQTFKKVPFEDDENTLNTVKRMVTMWTNFAKFGNPTPKDNPHPLIDITWSPVTKDKQFYLNIDKKLKVDVDPDKERLDFWKNLFTKYNGDFITPKI